MLGVCALAYKPSVCIIAAAVWKIQRVPLERFRGIINSWE